MMTRIARTHCLLWITWWLGFLLRCDGVDLDYQHITVYPEHIVWPAKKQEGTIIFLHGMTEIGTGIDELVKLTKTYALEIPHLKVVFPTAPMQPYSLMGGARRHVWFDQKVISPYGEENLESMAASYNDLQLMIEREMESGVPLDKIMIGGFSMGGEMAIHMGYRFYRDIGGVFAFSACLNQESIIYQEIENQHINGTKLPETYLGYGNRDDITLVKWAEETIEKMQKYSIRLQADIFKELGHEVHKDMFDELWYWVLLRIPDVYPPNRMRKIVEQRARKTGNRVQRYNYLDKY